MIAGIVGLGLIGGSFAKAYKAAGHTVLACDTDENTLGFAKLSGAVDGDLTDGKLCECDIILVCVYPAAAIEFFEKKGGFIGKKPVVIDCCGTKRVITEAGMAAAREKGFTYVGGHPMAGTQYSGFKYSKPTLFVGAPMVIVPPVFDDITFFERIKTLLAPARFGTVTVTTAEKHDEMIAFTSQLAHVVSSAYIKSPTALAHKGFSAGSYRDLTRVAWLNPEMWAQLFLDNGDCLVKEIDAMIKNLSDYRSAIAEGDKSRLTALLQEGKEIKEKVDGK